MLLCCVILGFNILYIYNLDYSFPIYYITPQGLFGYHLLLKVLYIKVKISWNSTLGPINNTKKCSGTHE